MKHGRLGVRWILVRFILVYLFDPRQLFWKLIIHLHPGQPSVWNFTIWWNSTRTALYTSTIRRSMKNIGFNIYSVTLKPQGIWEESPVAATPNYPKLVILHIQLIEVAHNKDQPFLYINSQLHFLCTQYPMHQEYTRIKFIIFRSCIKPL